jgi:hypothetical protein
MMSNTEHSHSASIYDDHPIFNPLKLRITTPAVEQLKEDIHRWVWTGVTGAILSGTARVGKTTAIEMLCDQICTRGNKQLPCFYVSNSDRDQKTIASIFRNLCWNSNLKVNRADNADHMSDRFVHFVVDQAAEAKCPHVVIIVDEMQRLLPKQFNAFAEIYDKLSLFKIASTTLFIGNDPEYRDLLKQVQSTKYAHIRGRFFTQAAVFKGLTSAKEVEFCLKQYDQLRFPEDGDTYTEFFLPDAVHQGWQLSSLSHRLWRVFREYQKIYNFESWGMQYFTATISTLLADYLTRYGVEDIPDQIIRESITLSGLISSSILIDS